MDLDWTVLIEGGVPRLILAGLATTVQLTVYATILALVLGTILALLRNSRFRAIKTVSTWIVDFVRSTPPLVQLLFWYFGASYIFPQATYYWLVQNDLKFSIAIIGLGLYQSAFIAEVIRSGLQSVPRGQMEAALTVGLSKMQAMGYVIFHQVLRITLLPLINELLSLMKNTSLAVAIGVAELTYVASELQDRTFRVVEAFTAITVIYLILSLSITFGSKFIGRRLKVGSTKRLQGI